MFLLMDSLYLLNLDFISEMTIEYEPLHPLRERGKHAYPEDDYEHAGIVAIGPVPRKEMSDDQYRALAMEITVFFRQEVWVGQFWKAQIIYRGIIEALRDRDTLLIDIGAIEREVDGRLDQGFEKDSIYA